MNPFRRLMITLSVGACCVLSFLIGKNADGWTMAVVPVLGFMALTYWSLTGWDASDTRVEEAKEVLERLDPAVRASVESIAGDGRTIEAIKELRAATGLGLAEAKAIVDLVVYNQKVGSDQR